MGGGERRSIALLLASEMGSDGRDTQENSIAAQDGRPDGGSRTTGGSYADELWLRLCKPLADRNYSANAVCTLSDGVEQWAAALAQHTQTSRVVLAVAPSATLQGALAAAFRKSGADRVEPTVAKAGANGSGSCDTGPKTAAATRWPELLPGSVLLDKNGEVIALDHEASKESGDLEQEAVLTKLARLEDAVAVVYENVICCPAAGQRSSNAEAAIAAVCAAADSGSGPIGLL